MHVTFGYSRSALSLSAVTSCLGFVCLIAFLPSSSEGSFELRTRKPAREASTCVRTVFRSVDFVPPPGNKYQVCFRPTAAPPAPAYPRQLQTNFLYYTLEASRRGTAPHTRTDGLARGYLILGNSIERVPYSIYEGRRWHDGPSPFALSSLPSRPRNPWLSLLGCGRAGGLCTREGTSRRSR
jgi:hypothetical protein